MKKIAFYSIALLTACTMLMVGCQPKDEPQTPEQPEQPEQPTKVQPAAALMNYTFELSDEMMDVADYTIYYYDKDGQLQNEQITSTTWNKIMTAALPAKLGIKVMATLKEGVDYSKYEVFTAYHKYSYKAYCLDAEGKQIGDDHDAQSGGNTYSVSMAGDKIEGFFNNKYKDKPVKQTLYKVDAEGNFTYLEEWE